MQLNSLERDILKLLLEQYREDEEAGRTLDPSGETAAEFEAAIKRLDRNGFLEIVERSGSNAAVLRLTPRGERLCHEREIGDAETRTLEVPVLPAWKHSPGGLEFIRYDDLSEGDRFEDRTGRVWEVPKQVNSPDATRRLLNRVAIDRDRGTSAIVPEESFVKRHEE